MNKKILLGLFCMVSFIHANEYHKNLQVFTVNTAEKRCTTPLHVVYKGDKNGYGREVAKQSDDIMHAALGGTRRALNGLQSSSGADALTGGIIVGLGVFAINKITDGITGDNEYLYVTECNSGENRTRLMTLVVSNDKMSEAQWTATAKKDQSGSAK